MHGDDESEHFQVDVKISCFSTLTVFFYAYFIPKGWQPSLLLILLTRNLIPSNAVIPPQCKLVAYSIGGILRSAYVCSVWLPFRAVP